MNLCIPDSFSTHEASNIKKNIIKVYISFLKILFVLKRKKIDKGPETSHNVEKFPTYIVKPSSEKMLSLHCNRYIYRNIRKWWSI